MKRLGQWDGDLYKLPIIKFFFFGPVFISRNWNSPDCGSVFLHKVSSNLKESCSNLFLLTYIARPPPEFDSRAGFCSMGEWKPSKS